MRRSLDFLTFVVAAAACILVANVLLFEGAVAFLAAMLVDTIVYSWSRRFPDELLSFFGVFEFSSSYLPFVLALWGAMIRGVGHLKYELVAIAVGHVLWFVADVVPHITGWRILAPGDTLVAIGNRVAAAFAGRGAAGGQGPAPAGGAAGDEIRLRDFAAG